MLKWFLIMLAVAVLYVIGVEVGKSAKKKRRAAELKAREEKRAAERAEAQAAAAAKREEARRRAAEENEARAVQRRERGEQFSRELTAIPRAAVTPEPPAFSPDSDPDLSAVSYRNVTSATKTAAVADFVAVDVETTGLRPERDEIVQLAAVRFEGGQPAEAFVSYVKPRGEISEGASRVNGITAETVAEAPEISQLLNTFRRFVPSGLPVVGHNLPFDLAFLVRSGCLSLADKRAYYDTLALSRRVWKLDSYKLDALERSLFSLSRGDAHDALSDAYLTGLLFKGICEARIGK